MKGLGLVLVVLVGCGQTFNKRPATIIPPVGGLVDGRPGPATVDKRQPHEVIYPNGQRCIVDTSIGMRYLVPDIFLTFLIGVYIDAKHDTWLRLDEDTCPDVIVRN